MLHSQDPQLHIHTLSNGLTVFFKQNNYPKNRVYMELLVRVGARHEPREINGISHFIEHMAFKTTKHFKNGQVFQELKEAGVSQGHHANAYTGFGRTVYHFYVPNTQEILDKSLRFLAEFAFHQAFVPEEVEKERSVILEELRRAQDKDYTYYTQMLGRVFDPASPLGQNTVLGTEVTLASLTPEILAAFYQEQYVPGNMILTIVGDCSYEELAPTIQQHFAEIAPRTVPVQFNGGIVERSTPDVYTHQHKEYTEQYCGIIFPQGELPNHTPQERAQQFHYVLLQWILQERFHDIVQEESNISAMGVSKDTMNFLPSSLFFAYVYSQGRSLKRGISLLLATIHYLSLHGPEPAELALVLEKAREYIISSRKELHVTAHPSFANSIQQAYLGGFSYYTPGDDLDFFEGLLSQITVEDIREVCRTFWDLKQNPLLTFTLPQQQRFDEDAMKMLYSSIRESQPEPRTGQSSEDLYFPLAPVPTHPIMSKTHLPSVDAELYTLSNGIEVFVKHTDLEPDTVYCSLTALGGQLYETPTNKGLSDAYVATLLRGGSTSHSFREIQRYVSPKKMFFSLDKWSSIGMMFSITAAPHTIAEALTIVTHGLTFPAFREYDTAVSLKEAVQNQRQHETTQDFATEEHFSKLLFGDHPAGFTARAADMRRISRDQLLAFHEQVFPSTRSKALLVGNLKGIDIEDLLSRTLATLPKVDAPLPKGIQEYTFPQQSLKRSIRKGSENKAHVRLAYPGPVTTDATYPAFSLYTDVLTELLEEQVREQLGGTYSIYAVNGAASFLTEGTLEIGFECDPERSDELITSVHEVLRNAPNLITTSHLLRALKPLLSWFEEQQQENDLWLRTGRYLALGRTPDWLFLHMKELEAVTLEEILSVAHQYCSLTLPSVELRVLPHRGKLLRNDDTSLD